MPGNIITFGFVVEGHGEEAAVPVLVRRICFEVLGVFAVKTTRPLVRKGKSKVVGPGEPAIRFARIANQDQGSILVIVDADKDCPFRLGPDLKSRAMAVAGPCGISVVIPKVEFETWFLTTAQSLAGKRGLRQALTAPLDPESIRGAKEWLSDHMVADRKYSPTVDQAALVAAMDLVSARSCRSFDRLCREIDRLVHP